MLIKCDLHIHSALSPCAENDMTPGNIVGMSCINGLDVIAITDHQTCGNVRSAITAANRLYTSEKRKIVVIPGMEIECQEGFHLLALFPDVQTAEDFEKELSNTRLTVKNRPEIFGRQILFDEDDNEKGEVEGLLLTACEWSSNQIASEILALGGLVIPAHIDRDSYSILIHLGAFPPEYPVRAFELSKGCDLSVFFEKHPDLKHLPYVMNSDAHRLEDISDGFVIDVPSISEDTLDSNHVLQALREKMMK